MESPRYIEPEAPCYPDLRGRVAIVTGAGTNIGRGIALRLAREGARLLICGRRESLLEETCGLAHQAGAECAVLRADLTSEQDIDRLFNTVMDAYGTLDVLIQNAADMRMTYSQEATLAEWDHSFATIARGAFLLASQAYKLMEPRRDGVLIFVSTVGALRAHRPGGR
ncbi:MAG: hypothetical protein A3K19_17170 [Lentisphaerae bacterium RIFOXYB12_FULL_65_16]|nr:MAG: hypothetical protein A3K18_34200 [Lentisphaerae bacterium RIFOXYA12_64_32]OGV93519.1 MAG: hypothetical protein A3K19_17170 [Lentisphaerae bacterium RIFOXYB12_FULL_65_16]